MAMIARVVLPDLPRMWCNAARAEWIFSSPLTKKKNTQSVN
jgi:hypothetical protein